MIQINDIRYLSHRRGRSVRSICRETGHNFRTVSKYIEKTDFREPPKPKRGRPSVLDPVKTNIDTWLMEDLKRPPKQRHTAKRIYDRLNDEHSNIFNASDRTVRIYVAAKKKELYGINEGPLPLEHPPGEAQADFGEVVFYENGKMIKGHEFVLSFPHSNGSYVQLFKGQNQECLLTGLKDIFEHMGQVPNVIWFDNLSAAVAEIIGPSERKLTEQFLRFSLHYGFEARFCNPDAGHEKGHVENKVGYERRNRFVPEPRFANLQEFNRSLFAMAEKDMTRLHYKKRTSIARLMADDIQVMQPLPEQPFEVAKWQKIKANPYGKIKFDGNTYSVSPQVSRKEVWVKATAHTVEVLDENYRSIVNHTRLYGNGLEAMDWYPYLVTLIKRPTALKYTGFYRDLPDPWRNYLDHCDYHQKKNSLKLLLQILSESDMDTATQSLEATSSRNIPDHDSIRLSYYRLIQSEPEEIVFRDTIADVAAYHTDLSRYDLLLNVGEM